MSSLLKAVVSLAKVGFCLWLYRCCLSIHTSPQLPQPPPHQLRLGLGFRQVGLAFGHHLRRRLAGEVGVGEAAGQGGEAQQPLDRQLHLRLAAHAGPGCAGGQCLRWRN